MTPLDSLSSQGLTLWVQKTASYYTVISLLAERSWKFKVKFMIAESE